MINTGVDENLAEKFRQAKLAQDRGVPGPIFPKNMIRKIIKIDDAEPDYPDRLSKAR